MRIDVTIPAYEYTPAVSTPVTFVRPVSPVAAVPAIEQSPAVLVEISPEGRAAYEASKAQKPQAAEGAKPCATCQNRKYVDSSSDPSVSFKSPTKIDPGQAMSAVAAHEGEHVRNEQARADKEGRKVISQSVSIHMSLCPECGRPYVSGGETRTVTASEEKRHNSNNNDEGLFDLSA